jgi:DNA-directed RNA polymerase subunit RPC12/RpoP
MKYKIKGLSGSRPTVSFRCEQCHGGLVASLDEAGQSTECPSCGSTIGVPGERELAEWKRHCADQKRADIQKQAERASRRERSRVQAQEAAPAAVAAAETAGQIKPSPAAVRGRDRTGSSWHVKMNEQLASVVSVLNAVAFYVVIVLCTIAGAIGGMSSGIEQVGAGPGAGPAPAVGALIGAIVGCILGVLIAFMYCGLIAVIINISNKLTIIAAKSDGSP